MRPRGACPAAVPPRPRRERGAALAPQRGCSGTELTEQASQEGGQGAGRGRTRLPDSAAVMDCCGGEERSSPPISVLLLLMNGPGGWIVQSVLYLHQTVKPLPLLIICHNFTEHTLRPKGSPCPVACPFPPLSGRALSGQGARGRGPLSAESFSRPLPSLFPFRLPQELLPEGLRPLVRGVCGL